MVGEFAFTFYCMTKTCCRVTPGVQFPEGAWKFSRHPFQTGVWTHLMGTDYSFPGSTATGAWSWPPTSFQCWSYELSTICLRTVVPI